MSNVTSYSDRKILTSDSGSEKKTALGPGVVSENCDKEINFLFSGEKDSIASTIPICFIFAMLVSVDCSLNSTSSLLVMLSEVSKLGDL